VDKGNFSTKNLLLNAAVVLVGVGLALLSLVRHAHWGPEGPVGGWILLVPYLFMAAAVTAALIAWGTFSWVPGGRLTCFFIWIGLLIAFAVSGYYSMSRPETKYEQFAALSGWLFVAGCFVAVNATPSIAARTAIVATLGLGGVAGWLQVAVWLSEYSQEKAQLAESQIAHEKEFQDSQDADFRALGKEAPLWNYLGFMYISNEELRKECHEIIAKHADRDAELIDYLGSETLASDATRYIGEFHPAPGPVLAPAFARRSDLILSRIPEVNAGSDQISERSYADIRDIIRAAARIHKGGGDLTPQMERWRSYLKGFKNTADLVAEIDRTLSPPNAHADPPIFQIF
jgi:hypothetical protein